jgi:hypothetical protein
MRVGCSGLSFRRAGKDESLSPAWGIHVGGGWDDVVPLSGF